MRVMKLLLLITLLSISALASHTGGDKQETQESVFDTLRSFDDTVLQLAMRLKVPSRGVIPVGRETLVFLSSIGRVQVMLPQLEEYGLTEKAVKTGIELRLRQNGIDVYDVPYDPNGFRAFMLSHPDFAFFSKADLGLTVDIISLSERNIIAASAELSQSQIVNLLSAEKPTFAAVKTWHASQQVLSSKENIARGCREAIDELVDMYCNDWLATHAIQNRVRLPQNKGSTDSEH